MIVDYIPLSSNFNTNLIGIVFNIDVKQQVDILDLTNPILQVTPDMELFRNLVMIRNTFAQFVFINIRNGAEN